MSSIKTILFSLFICVILTSTAVHAQKDQETLHVFPNPMIDKATLEIRSIDNRPKEIVIYSIIGKELHRQQLLGNGHHSKFEVDFSFLNPGVYFLSLLCDDETVATKKIVKKQ